MKHPQISVDQWCATLAIFLYLEDLLKVKSYFVISKERCSQLPVLTSNNCFFVDFTTCASDQFRCYNGICLPGSLKCDRDADCLGGEDEKDCKFEQVFTLK